MSQIAVFQRLELGKQALATDRQLSSVKRETRDFAGKKALKYWRGVVRRGAEKIKGGLEL